METYPLDPEKTYYSADYLTLDGEDGGKHTGVEIVNIKRAIDIRVAKNSVKK